MRRKSWRWLALPSVLLALTMVGSAAARPAIITGHECSLRNGELVVDSTWIGGAQPDLALARPLPEAAKLVRVSERPARWQLRVPLDALESELPLPMPAGDGWHRVHIDRSLDFVPASSLGLVLQLGHHATSEIDRSERRVIDAALGTPTPRGAYYASSGNIERAGGFAGEISARSALHRRAMWAAALLFILTSAAMVLIYRRLSRRAELERAEELIRTRFAELEDG